MSTRLHRLLQELNGPRLQLVERFAQALVAEQHLETMSGLSFDGIEAFREEIADAIFDVGTGDQTHDFWLPDYDDDPAPLADPPTLREAQEADLSVGDLVEVDLPGIGTRQGRITSLESGGRVRVDLSGGITKAFPIAEVKKIES